MSTTPLFDRYSFRTAELAEFSDFINGNRDLVFHDVSPIPAEDYMTGGVQRRRDYDAAVTALYELRIFILHGDEIIGWHSARQGVRDHAHMSNTGILPGHRGKGIYQALLPRLLTIFREAGFAKVSSRHHASNNAVLVPKLKAGFVITGFEIDERYGLFVILTYIYDQRRLDAYRFRVGAIRPDEELRKYL